jgi:putative acetyltransferase
MISEGCSVRSARPEDREAIRAVHVSAFPAALEADLVETLVEAKDATLSLVAEQDGQVLGHILCSRMEVEGDGKPVRAVGLAPVAVIPDLQGKGIGAALIRAAIERSRAAGEQMMFVLGEPDYYSRFGFSADAARPFASPYAGEYFMAIRFDGAAPPQAGRADYAPAFAALEEEA